MERYKKMLKQAYLLVNQNKIIVVSVLFGIMLAIIWAIINTKYVDYNPINGDFQNYNPVRRLLDGQIPFKDFSVYLGCGQLYLEAFILCIIGNTFKNSLIAMYFLSVFCFWLTIMIVIFIITKSKILSVCTSNLLLFLNIYRPVFFINNMIPDLWAGLNMGIGPGNSARLIRGFVIIILSLLILILCKKIYNKNKKIRNITCFVAFISGIFLLWSNDYGVASSFSIAFVYGIIIFKCFWKQWILIVKQAGLYICMYLCGVITAASLVTKMNITYWLHFMFGVGNYQQWYYERQLWHKTYYIYEIDYSIWSILALQIALYYIIKIIRTKSSLLHIDSLIRDGLLAYIYLTAFLGVNLYRLISGGVSEEILQVLLIGYGLGVLAKLVSKVNLKTIFQLTIAVNILIVAYSVSTIFYNLITKNDILNNYQYIGGKIGGYLNELEAKSLKVAEEKLEGKIVFATYASGVEAYMNLFQPTQYDYIIHVLGDDARKQYLDIFEKGDHDYVSTIREDYALWEYWIKNANWFFYRQLYAKYIPTFLTGYQLFWKKGDVLTYKNTPEINIENVGDKIKIILKYNESIHAIADVSITYHTEYMNPFYKTGAFKKMVHVDSTSQKTILNDTEKEYADFFIPEKSDKYFVPITIVNGYGEISLEGAPINQVKINLSDVTVQNTFCIYKNLQNVYNLTDKNWVCGVNDTDKKLLFENTEVNREILQNAKYIQSNEGERHEIQSVEIVDENYIWVYLNTKISIDNLKYPNNIFAIN